MTREEICRCIEEGRMELFGQPKWTVGKNTCNTYEVFVEKILLPDGGREPAQEVLAQIEADAELTERFSDWFMHAAMQSGVTLSNQTNSNMTLSMNVLPSYANGPAFVKRVQDELKITGMRPDKLHFELSEAQLLTERGIQNLNQLHDETGISLWLGNFGTGHSNIDLLMHVHFDGLEIDRSFVKQIPINEQACRVLVGIAHLADTLDLHVCAKGIEVEEQMEFCEHLDFFKVQGYMIGMPMDLGELREYILKYAKGRER